VAEDFYQQLVDLHYATLYRFAYSFTRNEAPACDLTQQTFYIWASGLTKETNLSRKRSPNAWRA